MGDAFATAQLPLFACDSYRQALARELELGRAAAPEAEAAGDAAARARRVAGLRFRLAKACWLGGRFADARAEVERAREAAPGNAQIERTAREWARSTASLEDDVAMPLGALLALCLLYTSPSPRD